MNGPRATVVSGALDALALLERDLSARGVTHRRLDVAYAFHSEQMEEPARSLEQALAAIQQAGPDCTVVSTVTGEVQSAGDFTSGYWRRNMREPVLFEAGVRRLLALGSGISSKSAPRRCWRTRSRPWPGRPLSGSERPPRMVVPRVRRPWWSRPRRSAKGARSTGKASIGHRASRPICRRLRLNGSASGWPTSRPGRRRPRSRRRQPMAMASGNITRPCWRRTAPASSCASALSKRREPGFSWLRPWIDPSRYPDEYAIAAAAVGEVASVLFKPFDMHHARTVLDIGCGYATDLVTLAAAYPQLSLRGSTSRRSRCAAGRRRVAESGLSARIEIVEADSRYDDIPGEYDVVLSFQVAHHVREKDALFRNVGARLASDGVWLLEEVLSRLEAGIAHEASSAWFVSPGEFYALPGGAGIGGGLLHRRLARGRQFPGRPDVRRELRRDRRSV